MKEMVIFMVKCGIYKIENMINHKVYIGQSVNIYQRWCNHKNNISLKSNILLYRAINKYGLENFSFEIIEEYKKEKLTEREKYWVDIYNSMIPYGYNVQEIGNHNYSEDVFYDYKELADSYLELKSIFKVAEKFNCDFKTVSKACQKYNIKLQEGNKKSIAKIDKNNNEILEIYDSAHKTCEALNIPYTSALGKVCNGKRKTAYGYKWKYIGD